VDNYTYAPTGQLGTSDATIVVSWSYNGVAANTNVIISVMRPYATLEVTKSPNKTVYAITTSMGENNEVITYYERFDPTGMIVTATLHQARGTETQVITNYTYPNEDLD